MRNGDRWLREIVQRGVGTRFNAAEAPETSITVQRFETGIDSNVGEPSGSLLAPYLVVVATDARYYADLSANVFASCLYV
jgi:hypothetical protein